MPAMAGRRGRAAPVRAAGDAAGAALWPPCLGNVVGRPDRRGSLYPAKQRPETKIDAAMALIWRSGAPAMAADSGQPDISDFLRARLFA